MSINSKKPFWQSKHLNQMSREEWESVCDGCAKCCLVQLEDEQTGEMVYTNVACDLLDTKTCRCTQYERRSELVESCITMNQDTVAQCVQFAPDSCAYRLLLEGKGLPSWHHLVSENKDTIHAENRSVKNKTVKCSEVKDEDLEDYVVNWV